MVRGRGGNGKREWVGVSEIREIAVTNWAGVGNFKATGPGVWDFKLSVSGIAEIVAENRKLT